MNQPADLVQQEVDRLYKNHYGQMVAFLLNFFRDSPLETVEDLVQDSFTAALTVWRTEGIPSNAAGWIYTVCRNKGLNKIRAAKKIRRLSGSTDNSTAPPVFRESAFEDQTLQLLFACAHPDLSPKVQVVITLKYVANLKVAAIAKALGMSIDGIDKLLLRARKKIKEENIFLKEPPLSQLGHRLPIVHKIIYLIFNEGYKPSTGDDVLKESLCEEALLVNKALLDKKMGDTATAALHALMLFNAARFKARSGPGGELLDLEEQDRQLWNRPLIALACDLMKLSIGGEITSYHCEAAIAFLHCTAPNFQSTSWTLISDLYGQLLQLNPNPFVELNYAIALYYSGQKTAAFQLLDTLRQQPFLDQYYLLNATLGKIHLLEGELEKARLFFERTLQQTTLIREKEFILKMMKKINNA